MGVVRVLSDELGLPVSLTGNLTIQPEVDEDCAGNLITRRDGGLFGVWLDDTTPRLEHYVALAAGKYGPQGLAVVVCVPPGFPFLHHGPRPPVINAYERYIYGMGSPATSWPRCPRRFGAYVVQQRWAGTRGTHPPTPAQRARLLEEVEAIAPDRDLIFLF